MKNDFTLPFRYAQRSSGDTRDYVFFAAYDPVKGSLKRKRIYIDRIKDKAVRDRYAKKLITHINNLLDAGKNPFIDQDDNKKYCSIREALKFVMDLKLMYIRKRTQHSFESRIRILEAWLEKKKLLNNFIFEFTEDLALVFMNSLVVDRKIKGRTFNNYLIDYRSFFNTLVKNRYITTNPFHAVQKMPEQETEKRAFFPEESERYFQFIKQNDYDFFIISLYCYYLALRPAEICRLRVSDFHLSKEIVVVPGTKSKNKRNRIIPIAKPLQEILKNYFRGIPSNLYICSKGLKPGNIFEHSTRIAEHFREIANKIQLPSEVKFYSLKDTAADRLLEYGFTLKTIRDLFGHSSIAVTDAYLKKFKNIIDRKLVDEFPDP